MLAAIVLYLSICLDLAESKEPTESRSSTCCREDDASTVDEYAGRCAEWERDIMLLLCRESCQ